MAFYQQADPKPLGVIFREGLDALRTARFKLAHAKGAADGMTNEQFAAEFGYTDAANAKGEMASGVGKLLSDGTGGDASLTIAQQYAAVVQMLNQFG